MGQPPDGKEGHFELVLASEGEAPYYVKDDIMTRRIRWWPLDEGA
jgi:hypothetical protein